MWQQLWGDFSGRFARVMTIIDQSGGPEADYAAVEDAILRNADEHSVIDRTILWQLFAHPVYGHSLRPRGRKERIPVRIHDPHLPELYSGAPWRAGLGLPQRLEGKWVGLFTINPTLNGAEDFPPVSHWPRGEGAMIEYFEHRFDPGIRNHPYWHGRKDGLARVFTHQGEPKGQSVWTKLDRLLNQAITMTGIPAVQAPLGQVAAVMDVVPWKFKNWGDLPEQDQSRLLQCGEQYFRHNLARRPAVAVALGLPSWAAFQRLPMPKLVVETVPVPNPEVPKGGWTFEVCQIEVEPEWILNVIKAPFPTSIPWNYQNVRRTLAELIGRYANW